MSEPNKQVINKLCPNCKAQLSSVNHIACPYCGYNLHLQRKTNKKRPLGISLLAIGTAIFGPLSILGAIGTIIGHALPIPIVGILAFAAFASCLYLAVAVWRLKKWVLYVNMGFCFIGIAGAIIEFTNASSLTLTADVTSGTSLLTPSLIWLYYLYSRRTAFLNTKN